MTRKNSGSLMMESLVAMALVVVGLFGIFNLIYVSIGADSLAVHKLQATYLAAEGVEVMKNIIDENFLNGGNWADIFPNILPASRFNTDDFYISYDTTVSTLPETEGRNFGGTPYLKFDPSSGFFQYKIGTQTPFVRDILVTGITNSIFQIDAVVTWSEKGQSQSVTLEDRFYE